MKAVHVLSLAGVLALSGVVLAQVTQTSGSSSSQTSSSSSRSGQSSSSGQTSGNMNGMGMIDLKDKKIFAVLCEPGENWKENAPVSDQDLDNHIAYLEKLKADNILVMAGPFMDNTGGEYVIVAKNQKEAEAIVTQDPGYQAKILAPSVHEWYLAVKSPQMLMSIMGSPIAGQNVGNSGGGVRTGSGRNGG